MNSHVLVMPAKYVTLGLGLHRPEMVPAMGAVVADCRTIVLEEPPDPNFEGMLRKDMDIDEYMMGLDIEYPIYSRSMCRLMQRLYAQGKIILQVEPYLESLLNIHTLFADGGRPTDLNCGTVQHSVYLAEKRATDALLTFYQVALTHSVDTVVRSVMHFARQDAFRFHLRDTLRARVLGPLIERHPSIYIEAGLMHFALSRILRKYLKRPHQLKTIFLADKLLNEMGLKGRLYGPGEQLTLRYILHSNLKDTLKEATLAARSLIYNKLVRHEEDTATDRLHYLRSELAAIELVQQLTLAQCRQLYANVRNAGQAEAIHQVAQFQPFMAQNLQEVLHVPTDRQEKEVNNG